MPMSAMAPSTLAPYCCARDSMVDWPTPVSATMMMRFVQIQGARLLIVIHRFRLFGKLPGVLFGVGAAGPHPHPADWNRYTYRK